MNHRTQPALKRVMALAPLFGVVVLVCATRAQAEDWQTVMTGPISIKNRALPGTSVKEVWAEADLKAPVYELQETLMRVERFRYFMPYLKDSREVGAKLPDGSVYVYTLIDLPVVGKRDYVVRTWLLKSVEPDQQATFENRWEAFPEHLPLRAGITRIRLNSGGWVVTPNPDGMSSHVVYKFTVDPGGWLPGFAINIGNEKGVGDTLKGVEVEAQRRVAERRRASAPDGGVATDGGSR